MRDRASQTDRGHKLGRSVFFLIGPVVAAISFVIVYAVGASLWVAIVVGVVLEGVLQPFVGRLLLPEVTRQVRRERKGRPRYLSVFHDRGTAEWKRHRTGRGRKWSR